MDAPLRNIEWIQMNYSLNPTITHVPSSTLTAPRGPLALLVKPPPSPHNNEHDVVVTTQSSSSSCLSTSRYHLHYFQCNPIAPCFSRVHSSKMQQPSRRRRRRRQRRQGTLQQEEPGQEGQDKEKEQLQSILQEYYQNEKMYHPHKEAFTLLFFCELNCRNSQRFTMVLSSFLKTIQSMENFENDKPPPQQPQPQRLFQLICIPNDDLELSFLLNDTANVHDDVENNPTINHDCEAVSLSQRKEHGREANILTHLMSCCDFWHMGYDHCNRLSMIR